MPHEMYVIFFASLDGEQRTTNHTQYWFGTNVIY